MTVRSGEAWPAVLSEFVAETVRSPRVSRLSCAPLVRTACVEQVQQLAAGPVAPPVLDRVRRLGEGIPFWTEELVLGGLDGTGPVPATVRGLIEARLLRLEDGPRALWWRRSPSWTTPTTPCSGTSATSTRTPLDRACADAVRHHILLVDDDGAAIPSATRCCAKQSPSRCCRVAGCACTVAWAEQLDEAARTSGQPAPHRGGTPLVAGRRRREGTVGHLRRRRRGAAGVQGMHEQAQLLGARAGALGRCPGR